MQRCVIVGGAAIQNPAFVRSQLRADDYVIFCDSGLAHVKPLGLSPDLVVGDFDSYPRPDLPVETIVLPREKDDTDTVFAAKEALRRGFQSFLLIGAVGGRLDHTLANLSILVMLQRQGKSSRIVDDYSVMEMVGAAPVDIAGDCAFFSLLNITGTAEEIFISGAKYPLSGARIECSYQYGTSNEVLPGQTARVSVGRGSLLLIRVFRDSPK